ncbi:nucleotide exchange factor GrpE [Kaistia algarum]|uniref:nucleotide exchange factor GrpE n=1 Tax=Kaistia algarum TaxID=2083279 RepID=UPI000CE92D1F|nr:nucleotide exchange factor GrpE [Kaistia algarum]MCX5513836.1 nucleotide exchange factor GrpE [Kaistia algarum]PPE79304.1 nucleotide exchange factor GrpE [Kaistia algarum]
MSNDTQSPPGSETPNEAVSTPAGAEVAGEANARIAALEAEVAENKDRALRTLAEMENLRRRTERQVAEARQYSIAAFARDMLTAGDNLSRAIQAIPDDARGASEALTTLIEGVEMTERDLHNSLEKHGVKKLDPVGQKFDPNLHQAIFEVPTEEHPTGTVVQVMQPGYVIGERVLRPAMVGVAKGPAKPKAEKPASSDAEQSA